MFFFFRGEYHFVFLFNIIVGIFKDVGVITYAKDFVWNDVFYLLFINKTDKWLSSFSLINEILLYLSNSDLS